MTDALLYFLVLRSQLAKAERKGDGNEQCQLLSQLGSELSIGGKVSVFCFRCIQWTDPL